MFVLSSFVVVTGFGCGGIKVCMIVNVFVDGSVYLRGELLKCFVMLKMIGIIIIRFVLKKMGKLNSSDVMLSVNGVCCLLKWLISVFVSIFVLFVIFNILLIIVLRLISSVIEVSVLLKFVIMVDIILLDVMLVVMVVFKLIKVSEVKVWILK